MALSRARGGCLPEWIRALELSGFRAVEDQTRSSTRQLVDSEEEHALLESILERGKPPERAPELDYLLKTPFRYPPLPHGSRFGRAHEPGLFYGSLEERTCLGESAFYQLAFLRAARGAHFVTHEKRFTTFSFSVKTERGVDFTEERFLSLRSELSHPTSYAPAQTMGASLRERDVHLCVFWSARVETGRNVSVFDPSAFSEKRVPTRNQRTWYASVSATRVLFTRPSSSDSHHFRLDSFLTDGQFPDLPR